MSLRRDGQLAERVSAPHWPGKAPEAGGKLAACPREKSELAGVVRSDGQRSVRCGKPVNEVAAGAPLDWFGGDDCGRLEYAALCGHVSDAAVERFAGGLLGRGYHNVDGTKDYARISSITRACFTPVSFWLRP